MKTEIITIGTEVFIGDILNKKSIEIYRLCNEFGKEVYFNSILFENNIDKIIETLRIAVKRSEFIILTITSGIEYDELIRKILNSFSNIQIFANEYKNCTYHVLNLGSKVNIILAELSDDLLEVIKKEIVLYKEKIYIKEIKLININEDEAIKILDNSFKYQENVTISFYRRFAEIIFRIIIKVDDFNEAEKLFINIKDKFYSIFGRNIYTTKIEDNIENSLVKFLIDNNYTISTAESCTGGMIASTIINVSGASKIIKEAFVTYSNETKSKNLNIDIIEIEKFGEYSFNTARLMLHGLLNKTGANCGIAITGVADVYSDNSGEIYIATGINDDINVKCYNLYGKNRNENREMATKQALIQMYNHILGIK